MPRPNGKPPELSLSEVTVGGGGTTGPGTGGGITGRPYAPSTSGRPGPRVLFPPERCEPPWPGRELEEFAIEIGSLGRMDVLG